MGETVAEDSIFITGTSAPDLLCEILGLEKGCIRNPSRGGVWGIAYLGLDLFTLCEDICLALCKPHNTSSNHDATRYMKAFSWQQKTNWASLYQ
jgi:hypothetical protein